MELSTSINLLFGNGSVENQLKRITDAGFRYLDMNFGDWSLDINSPFVADNWKEWIYCISEFAHKNNIIFNQAHGPIYNVLLNNNMKEHLDKMSMRSIEAAALLEIPYIVFHAGSYAGTFDSEHINRLKQDNIEHFDKAVEMCQKINTGIMFENMADSFRASDNGLYCSVTDDLISLVDSFKTDRVAICWDTGHANIQKTNQKHDIIKIGGRLKALHIQDNDGIRDSHTAPFYGTINWLEIVEALKEVGYKGCFTYEAHEFVRKLPDVLKDYAIEMLYKIGQYLINI